MRPRDRDRHPWVSTGYPGPLPYMQTACTMSACCLGSHSQRALWDDFIVAAYAMLGRGCQAARLTHMWPRISNAAVPLQHAGTMYVCAHDGCPSRLECSPRSVLLVPICTLEHWLSIVMHIADVAASDLCGHTLTHNLACASCRFRTCSISYAFSCR